MAGSSLRARVARMEHQASVNAPCTAMQPIYVSQATPEDPHPEMPAGALVCGACGARHGSPIHIVLPSAEASWAAGCDTR
jgi:hypothetical protein